MLESALEGELTDHLGHEPGERAEGGRDNYLNGHRSKTVITESGPAQAHMDAFKPVEISLPWDVPEGKKVSARLIFTAGQGGMVWRSNFSGKEWKPARAIAGLIPPEVDENGKYESAREHGMRALRHFCASALLDAGENIKAVSEYMGHADPGLTLRVYAHLMPDSRERPATPSTRCFSDSPEAVFGCWA
ncbi:tyrosine-type recombinase/integrase [Streptomyces sp. NPDC001185]|uniref:tyrosine-type recombinase/integrase n=1 Tax=Streptomyces sp. NPDC001185 TaxID=3154380 RepID=UPI0033343655